ncbi:MAG: hypothetical protein V3T21_05575 [Candidatus Margulisiibacteriota bacterium]
MSIQCPKTGAHCPLMRVAYYNYLKPKMGRAHGKKYSPALRGMERGHFRKLRKLVETYPAEVRLAIRESAFFYRSHELHDLTIYLMELDKAGKQRKLFEILEQVPREKWNGTLYQIAGFANFELGKFKAALELIDSMPSQINWNDIHYRVKLKALNKLGRFRESLDASAEMPSDHWNNKTIVGLAAEAHYGLGEFEIAFVLLDAVPPSEMNYAMRHLKASLLNECKIEAQCKKAELHIVNERYALALDELAELRSQDWGIKAHNLAATAHYGMGQYQRALAVLNSLPRNEWNETSLKIAKESSVKIKEG